MRTSLRSKKIQNYGNIKSDTLSKNELYEKYSSKQSIIFRNSFDNIVINSFRNIEDFGKNTIALAVEKSSPESSTLNSILIGRSSGTGLAGKNCIGIGLSTFEGTANKELDEAIAISEGAGLDGLTKTNSINIGTFSGGGGSNSINIGVETGKGSEDYTIHIGYKSGGFKTTPSRQGSIGLGTSSANRNQGENAIAIGENSGESNQENNSVAIGSNAGTVNQALESIAIGLKSGSISQGVYSVALGTNSGSNNQGDYSIAIGSTTTGVNNQGNNAIAIGAIDCAVSDQSEYSLCIGNYSLVTNTEDLSYSFFLGNSNSVASGTPSHSFVINTSGSNFTPISGNAIGGLFINGPIRSDDIESNSSSNGILYFNPSTYEVTYNSS